MRRRSGITRSGSGRNGSTAGLRLNISGFYLEWSDHAAGDVFLYAIPGDATSNIQRTINVEEAEAKGFELELAAAPAERFLVTAGLGYTDSEINSDDFARISGNLTVSLKDRTLPRSPEVDLEYGGAIQLALGR